MGMTDDTWTCGCGSLNSEERIICEECEYNNMSLLNSTYKFNTFTQPDFVGSYRIGGATGMNIHFNRENKPNWINKQFCKWCLGWEWVEN